MVFTENNSVKSFIVIIPVVSCTQNASGRTRGPYCFTAQTRDKVLLGAWWWIGVNNPSIYINSRTGKSGRQVAFGYSVATDCQYLVAYLVTRVRVKRELHSGDSNLPSRLNEKLYRLNWAHVSTATPFYFCCSPQR